MRRIALRAWVLCWLMLVWILLWGTVSAANILSGLAIALLITVLLPLPAVPIEGRLHPLSLLRLIATVFYYLALSSVQVAWLAVKPGPPPLSPELWYALSALTVRMPRLGEREGQRLAIARASWPDPGPTSRTRTPAAAYAVTRARYAALLG